MTILRAEPVSKRRSQYLSDSKQLMGGGAWHAMIAGIAVWFFARFLGAIGEMNMGLTPQKLILAGLAWGLVDIVIATIAGALGLQRSVAALLFARLPLLAGCATGKAAVSLPQV